ncbi:hypothetical protein ACH4PU_30855 [Streptomyces sp. NPDC021100]|uniref:hypothetical protein n=1 Tax=Streptomyces sp. NPDC021100 TaxID=3365114 RepID=UPI003796FB8B
MSLTFSAEYRGSVAYVVTCGCEPATARAPRYGSYDDAAAAVHAASGLRERVPLPGCRMPAQCPHYPLHAEGIDPDGAVPDVNVHEENARHLLALLGLPAGGWQSPAGAFLGRVLTALALTPGTAGTPGAPGSACERGHLSRRLLELHDLAQWCARRGRAVTWS